MIDIKIDHPCFFNGSLKVCSVSLNEAISRCYSMEIYARLSSVNYDVSLLIGSNCYVFLIINKGKFYYSTIICNVSICGLDVLLQAKPELFLTSLGLFSDVYYKKSAPSFIYNLLDSEGIVYNSRLILSEYEEIECAIRYNESSFDFILRLMGEWGIYFYFDRGADREGVVINDKNSKYNKKININPTLLKKEGFYFKMLNFLSGLEVDPIKLKWFDREKGVFVEKNNGMAVGGVFFSQSTRDLGESIRKSRIMSEIVACNRERYNAITNISGIFPGCLLELNLTGVNQSLNGEYFVLNVSSKFDIRTKEFISNLEFIKYSVQFRSEITVDKVLITDLIQGKIIGPKNTDLATINEQGEYKVRLSIDSRDLADDNGLWAKPISMYGGLNRGIHFPLTNNTDVLVGFVGGCIEKPYIAGVVPYDTSIVNADNNSCSVISTPKGNQLTLSDDDCQSGLVLENTGGVFKLVDGEESSGSFFDVNSHEENVKNDYKTVIGGIHDYTAESCCFQVQNSKTSDIKGECQLDIGGSYTVDITKDSYMSCHNGYYVTVDSTYHLKTQSLELISNGINVSSRSSIFSGGDVSVSYSNMALNATQLSQCLTSLCTTASSATSSFDSMSTTAKSSISTCASEVRKGGSLMQDIGVLIQS